MTTRVTLIYPSDTMGVKVGGITTFLRGFIKYAPDDFDVEHVGVTVSGAERPVGRWSVLGSGRRSFRFFPLLEERDLDRKHLLPLSLRFTAALIRQRPEVFDRVLLFNRIEPAVVFARRRNRKIGFVHNDIEKRLSTGSEDSWRHVRWAYFGFERYVFRSLDQVFTVSRKSLELYRERYPFLGDRLGFLPTWADTDVFFPAREPVDNIRRRLAAAHDVPAGGPWILFVGRLQEQKAPLRLIETLREVERERRDVSLLVVGDGNLKGRMTEHARRLGVLPSVHFIGSQTQEVLADFYRAADVLLLASNFEGMPRSVVEALASGLPVVSTDVGEVSTVVRNGASGEVCGERTPTALAAALVRVLGDRARYSSARCVESVAGYAPANVLASVYARCRDLAGSA